MEDSTRIEITRIDNFVCPACGEVIRQVVAKNGVVKGWCHHAKKEINVVVSKATTDENNATPEVKPMSLLEKLKKEREKVLRDVVSAREDGDLRENSAYHAAREQLSILDDKIRREEERLKRENYAK